jgi:hypothetical protein
MREEQAQLLGGGGVSFLIMDSLPLSARQQTELATWIQEVRQHRQSFLVCAEALLKIKLSGYWRSKADSWQQFCEQHLSLPEATMRRWIQAAQFTESQRLIVQATGESALVPQSISQAIKLKSVGPPPPDHPLITHTEVNHSNLFLAPPISKPVQVEVLAAVEMDRAKMADHLGRAERWVKHLLAIVRLPNNDADVEASLRQALAEIQAVRGACLMDLPGMPEPVKKKARAARQEVIDYCVEQGLTSKDGEWFFDKQEGIGWKIHGVPIRDWRAVVRTWKSKGNIFPGDLDRLTGRPKEKSLSENLIEQEVRKAEKFLGRSLR